VKRDVEFNRDLNVGEGGEFFKFKKGERFPRSTVHIENGNLGVNLYFKIFHQKKILTIPAQFLKLLD
jgi:hypothetical protein